MRQKKRAATVSGRGPGAIGALPGLGKDERNCTPVVRLQDVHRRGVTTAGTSPVFERRVLIHNVGYHELNTDVLEVVVLRRVASIVAERQVEGEPCRFDIGVTGDKARE